MVKTLGFLGGEALMERSKPSVNPVIVVSLLARNTSRHFDGDSYK